MNKAIILTVAAALICGMASGCSAKGFSKEDDITVITREAGSGTRGAFVELFGIEQKDEAGNKIDKTIASAITNDKTGIVLTSVSQDVNSIGYISLGSLDDTVKALVIDGAEATVENVKNGDYKISRPFNIAVKDNVSEAAKDFINYIMSDEGQAVVESSGYIAVDALGEYSGTRPSGTVKISGSSSVTPVMEKLKEAYLKVNTNAKIEINMTDSTSGMTAVAEGASDIGMASREIKESELSKGLSGTVIAIDGIAVIVNNENPLNGLKADDVRAIYMGEAVKWQDIAGAEFGE